MLDPYLQSQACPWQKSLGHPSCRGLMNNPNIIHFKIHVSSRNNIQDFSPIVLSLKKPAFHGSVPDCAVLCMWNLSALTQTS